MSLNAAWVWSCWYTDALGTLKVGGLRKHQNEFSVRKRVSSHSPYTPFMFVMSNHLLYGKVPESIYAFDFMRYRKV